MSRIAVGTRYSSEVSLWLDTQVACYRLAKVGPNRVMLVEPGEIPAGTAEIVMFVDGRIHRTRVTLPFDAVPFDEFLEIECREPVLSPLGSDR